jgi:hypothetical protein
MSEQPPQRDENTYSPRAVLMALAVVLLLVAGAVYLVFALLDRSKIQDCVMQGRSNCAPVDSPAGNQ